MSSNENKIPGRGWSLLVIGWGVLFLAVFGIFVLGIILPTLRKEFGFGLKVAGMIASITFIVKVVIYIPVALFAARAKPKMVLGFAFMLMGIALILHGFATSVNMLYVARVLMSVASASMIAPLVLVKTNWVPKNRFSEINGYETFVTILGQLIGTAGVVFLVTALGNWRNMMITMGSIALIFAIMWFTLYKENDAVGAIRMSEKQPFIAPLKKAMKQPAVWLLSLGWPGTTLVWIAFLVFWPTYATETFGFTMAKAAMLIGIIPIASAIACLTAPRIANWIGVDKLMIWPWGFILAVAYFLTLQTGSVPLLGVMFFIVGYGAFAFVPVGMTVIYKIPGLDPGSISTGISVLQTLTAAGGALGGLLVGFLGPSIGLYKAMAVCCLAPIIFGILTLFLPEYGRKAIEKAKLTM